MLKGIGMNTIKYTIAFLWALMETMAGSGVCDRTQAVGEAITQAAGKSHCQQVSAYDLQKIEVLILSYKEITELKVGDFAGLSSLKKLGPNRNQLSTLPVGIFAELSELTEVFFWDNQFSSLPPRVFAGLPQLKVLNLGSNQLTTLPDGIFNGLNSLSLLNLKMNPLENLPTNCHILFFN